MTQNGYIAKNKSEQLLSFTESCDTIIEQTKTEPQKRQHLNLLIQWKLYQLMFP